MFEISSEIEQYILDHSERQDDLLYELYRETHKRVLHPRMLSGHLQGKILEMLSKLLQPSQILEIGTYTGYSAICLARGLTEGGMLHTIEVNDELEDFINHYLVRSGLKKQITLHIGDALEITGNLPGPFDLIYIDADKREYPDYLEICREKLRKGGAILADNVLWDGKVVHPDTKDSHTMGIHRFNEMVKKDRELEQVILPLRDGLMMIRKKG
ncbi:MAG: O-methyltransferase [Bacteroidales bacterium]|nr:O-methyltransferase [Bacteroidales bacterium]